MKRIALILLTIMMSLAAPAQAWEARVERAVDGDSPVVGGRELRLYGIDAPEHDQPHYRESRRMLEELLRGRVVSFEQRDVDPRGRPVVVAVVDGVNANAEMLRRGGAWWSRRYCKAEFCDEWRRLARDARQQGLGLWAEENPLPPWDWRRAQRPWERRR